MDYEVRPRATFAADEIRLQGRERAEQGIPMHPHNFGGDDAAIFERAYIAREQELRAEVEV